MPEDFEWQAGEERDSLFLPSRPPGVARRRRFLSLFTVALAVCLAAILLWQWAQQQVEDATVEAKEAVLASHDLALTAAREGDQELFASLLSPGDPDWASAQETLLEQELLFGGALRVFAWRPLGQAPDPVRVALNPELEQAEVKTQRAYAVQTSSGVTETVFLTQTLFYRRQDSRWLLSPLPADAWGGRNRFARDYVTVNAPARDQAIARRLADELDALLAQMCRTVVECPEAFDIAVHLGKEPLSLVSLAQPEAMLTAGRDLRLPAPSLVGRPADEAAYQALLDSYARVVVTAVVADLASYDCCDHALFFRALLERQLATLGLQPMPVPPVGYRLLDEDASLDAVQDYWQVDRPEVTPPLVVYAFLDFLVGTLATDPDDGSVEAELIGTLNEPVNVNFWAWVTALSSREDRAADETFTERWRHYFMGRLAAQGRQEGEPPANFDLLAACGTGELGVYRYHMTEGQWSLETEVPATGEMRRNHVHLMTLPDGDFVIRPFLPRDSFSTWLVRRGQPLLSLGEAGNPLVEVIPYQRGADGRLAAFLDNKAGDASALQIVLFDPEQCHRGCPLERLPGIPIWSPDGKQMLALKGWSGGRPIRDQLYWQQEITGADDAEWELLAEGAIGHPFWLGNDTIGYLWQRGAIDYGYEEVVLQMLATEEERRLLGLGDLLAEVGHNYPAFEIVWVAPHPLMADSLLVLATAFQQETAYLFVVERPTSGSWMEGESQVRLLADVTAVPQTASVTEPHLSPDGRWLSFVLPVLNRARRETDDRLWVYDLQEERTAWNVRAYIPSDRPVASSLGLYNWSPDGIWLARLIDGAVDLFAPRSEVRRLVRHDFARCTSVAWIAGE